MVQFIILENIEVSAEDYPREMETKRDRENKYSRFDEVSLLKDEIIKKLIINQK